MMKESKQAQENDEIFFFFSSNCGKEKRAQHIKTPSEHSKAPDSTRRRTGEQAESTQSHLRRPVDAKGLKADPPGITYR
jgi:hypothetical protein